MTKKAALYIRVSTSKQVENGVSMDAQERSLREYVRMKGWQIHRVYRDAGASGGSVKREAFQKLMDAASRGMFDVVVTYKLDRFSRSLRDLLNTLNKLEEYGVDFASVNDQLDTSTAAGRLMFQVVGAFAEFERALISERTKAGMEEARRQGKKLGRPRKKK